MCSTRLLCLSLAALVLGRPAYAFTEDVYLSSGVLQSCLDASGAITPACSSATR